VKKICNCRSCGSPRLIKIIDFPGVPLVDDYLIQTEIGHEFIYPIEIYFCADCYLVQTQHEIDVHGYYKDYHYSIAASPFARRFMDQLAQIVFQNYNLQPQDSVLEIGSSDGFQLKCFQDLGARVYGFEPSGSLVEASNKIGIPVAQTLFLPETIHLIPSDMLPLKMVLLTYTFDHLSDPVGLLKCINKVLDPVSGILIIEVHDLTKIIERREYCLFAHEHPTYWNLDTISAILEKNGFVLLNANIVPEHLCRANSLLVVAAPVGSKYQCDIGRSNLEYLKDVDTYIGFAQQVRNSLENFRTIAREKSGRGRRLAGYGAGGRGIMTLAMSEVGGKEFKYLCDMNPHLDGYYTPKSHIPLKSPRYLLDDWVDEVVVFSYGYMPEITANLSDYIRRGGKLTSMLELI
jgi:SAM-dependent methyltransferase